ncbi:dolichyl-phosphate-mannose-protein mannosyltransferase [Saccharopolyspora erythraea NRRL 2338]|nr:dolichyl-phosphate-mannose-protein mannosyltransferase [Saccharopolyspora erythraea NRRL 2338]
MPSTFGPAATGTRDPSPVPPPAPGLPPPARGPVLAVAAAAGALLVLLSGRYGYVTDELYFLAAGKYYLDWGYMDQQPLVPLLAWVLDAAFPGRLVVFRLPAVLVTVLGVVVTALITRELGGDRRAQTLAAAAYPLSPWLLLSGHWLAAATMEPAQWATVIWLLVRWVRLHRQGLHRDRLLLAAGLVVALAVQTKFQIVVLCVALLVSLLAVGPRALLSRPLLWVGAGVALITAVPTLVWQAANDWPALDMGTVVDGESSRLLFLPNVLLYSGIAVGSVFCGYGLWWLLRAPGHRFLGWTVAAVALFYLAASGRANYLAGLYALLFAAAAVGLQQRRERRGVHRWRRLPWPAYLLSAVLPLALLPIYPLPLLARHPEFPNFPRLYETGWPELARTVADTYHSLPAEVRRRTAVVGESYYTTGALDVHGRELGLPRAYSPHRGYWFFGAPPDQATAMLYVGNAQPLAPYFGTGRELATVHSDLGLLNLAQGDTVTFYEGPKVPWSVLWPKIRTM